MILLSFDTEEFDLPLEHGVSLSLEEQIRVSEVGMTVILDCLKRNNARATFFCTVTFAQKAPHIMDRIVREGHEVASHGYFHSNFEVSHLKTSRLKLEALTGQAVCGYRMARMMPVSAVDIRDAGYRYDSSLNPTFIPGRYMNLRVPRTAFMQKDVLQIPVSVTPWLRFPLFWLSCHNLPFWLYRALVLRTLRHDDVFTIYFHPWEFVDLGKHPEYGIPYIIRHHAGKGMEMRLEKLLQSFQKLRQPYFTYSEYTDFYPLKN